MIFISFTRGLVLSFQGCRGGYRGIWSTYSACNAGTKDCFMAIFLFVRGMFLFITVLVLGLIILAAYISFPTSLLYSNVESLGNVPGSIDGFFSNLHKLHVT